MPHIFAKLSGVQLIFDFPNAETFFQSVCERTLVVVSIWPHIEALTMVEPVPELALVYVAYILSGQDGTQSPSMLLVLPIAASDVQLLYLWVIANHLTLIH